MTRPSVTASVAPIFPMVLTQAGSRRTSSRRSLPEDVSRSNSAGRSSLSSPQSHPPGDEHRIHRKLLGAQVAVEEVNGEDEPDGQQCLLAVDQHRDVERPAGHETGEEGREPEEQPRGADDRHAPEHRPVVELLPVGEMIELRPRPQPQEPAHVLQHLEDVARLGHHRLGPPQNPQILLDEHPAHHVEDVNDEAGDHHRGEQAVEDAGRIEPAEQPGDHAGPTARR